MRGVHRYACSRPRTRPRRPPPQIATHPWTTCRVCGVIALWLLAGCGSSSWQDATWKTHTPSSTPAAQQQQIDAVTAYLGSRGYVQTRPVLLNRLQTAGVVGLALDTEPKRCYVAVALGREGQDLNLFLVDPEGQIQAYDVRPDTHPWVEVCSSRPMRLVIRAQMERGSGTFYFLTFVAGEFTQAKLDHFFGYSAAFGAPTAHPIDGTQDHGHTAAASRTPKPTPSRIPDATEPSQSPSGKHSPSQPPPHPPIPLAGSAGTGGTGGTGGAGEISPSGDRERFKLAHADMRMRGYEAVQPWLPMTASGMQHHAEVSLPGPACHALVAMAERPNASMSLRLLTSAGGEPLDNDESDSGTTHTRVCTLKPQTITLEAQITPESATYYAVYRWPRGTQGPFGLQGVIYVRLAEMTSLLQTEGYAPDPNHRLTQHPMRADLRPATTSFRLQSRICYSVLALGDGSLRDIELTLSRNGTRVSHTRRYEPASQLRVCPSESGTYQLRVRAHQGKGTLVTQVFRRDS
jgi:hypothetical protein